MSTNNKEIKENYRTYLELKNKLKNITVSPIKVDKIKQRHPSYKVGNTSVTHPTIKNKITFEVEIKINNTKDFKFKLFCSDIFECPFFRFDSAGATHRNYDPDIPLKEQMVLPPHFHEFNSKGVEIAYKTKALNDKNQLAYLENIKTCIMHFCEEGNVKYKNNGFPEVNLSPDELSFSFVEEDPLKNINF